MSNCDTILSDYDTEGYDSLLEDSVVDSCDSGCDLYKSGKTKSDANLYNDLVCPIGLVGDSPANNSSSQTNPVLNPHLPLSTCSDNVFSMASIVPDKITVSSLDSPVQLTYSSPDNTNNLKYHRPMTYQNNLTSHPGGYSNTAISILPGDFPKIAISTLPEVCPTTVISTSPVDCPVTAMPTVPRSYPATPISISTIPGGYPSTVISNFPGGHPVTSTSISTISGGHPATIISTARRDYPATPISTLPGGYSTVSSSSHPSLENITPHGQLERKLGVMLLSNSTCSSQKSTKKDNVCNKIKIMSRSQSQDRQDSKVRKMPSGAVNGIVQMASIMASTLETTTTEASQGSPKTLVSSVGSTSVEQDEKQSQADFLRDRMDNQTIWETFKMLAEKSLRNFSDKKPSRWKTVRHMVQWTPFIQTYKRKKYPWVQLAGHSGNFKAGKTQGTVLKKLCPQEEACYQAIMRDNTIKDLVPQYHGSITMDGDEQFIELQDCLSTFTNPCIMDCKVGVRTYLEEELAKARQKPTLRKDMYEKMVSVDPKAPTEEEHRQQGVTKPRYMVWRETISSTATLGFRIEGIKKGGVDFPSKDFKTTKTKEQLMDSFRTFLTGYPAAAAQYIQRLQVIRKSLEKSPFFNSQEVIGSSLLFVHDHVKSSIWMIDFGKTAPVPGGLTVDHRSPWQAGNHEDGYLAGLDSIINIFQQIANDG